MVAGTKRGVLLFALHAIAVQLLTALFTAFFVEYYFHECLVVVKSAPATAQTKVWLSRWGLSFFVLSQVVYAVLSALHRCGLLSLSSRLPPSILCGRLLTRPKWFSNEHAFVVAFGLSWCVLRLPLLPSAFCFTLALAAVSALAVKCTALTERAAREMAVQRPREGEWVGWAGLQATVAAAPLVFAAARLYDGTAPRSGQLSSFHGLLVVICVSVFVLFSVLQYLRGRMHAEESNALSRRDEVEPLPFQRLVSNTGGGGAATAEGAEFRAFVRQTCQRRSMKALLAVRAMHAYAYAILLFGTHLLLTLGGGLALSSRVRAALLAVVFAASSLLRPFCVALCTALGKKHAVSMTIAAVAATGNLALYAAYFTRGTSPAAEVKEGKATAATPLSTATEAAVDAFGAGTVWCVVLVVVQRLLLEVVGELLDLAQEDVVEEDAILFGRAASMTTWTSRLTSVATVPMQSLSLIITFLFLAVTSALRVVQQPLSAAAAAGRPSFLLSTSTPTTTTMMTSTTRLSSSVSAPPHWWVVASGSSVLALLGLQTCGVGVAMWVVWHRVYNLEGKHLQFVQMAIRKRKDEQALSLV